MHDDEINQMLQALKGAGVSDAQARHTLEILGRAEELNAELTACLSPVEKQEAKETVAAAIRKVFNEG